MKKLFRNFHNDELGQGLREYALLAAAIALGVVLVFGQLSTVVNGAFSNITTALGTVK